MYPFLLIERNVGVEIKDLRSRQKLKILIVILGVVVIVNSSVVEDGRWEFIQQELQVIVGLHFNVIICK